MVSGRESKIVKTSVVRLKKKKSLKHLQEVKDFFYTTAPLLAFCFQSLQQFDSG